MFAEVFEPKVGNGTIKKIKKKFRMTLTCYLSIFQIISSISYFWPSRLVSGAKVATAYPMNEFKDKFFYFLF